MKYFIILISIVLYLEAKQLNDLEAQASSAIINLTAEEAKNLALRRARSLLIEQANGTNISSNTLVKDGALAAEFIKSYSSGIILNEKIEWLPITQYQKDSLTAPIPEYNVKVTADVLIKEKETNLVLKTSINKNIFKNNEKMKIQTLVSEKSDIAIFFLGYDDKIYKLLPNLNQKVTINKNKKIEFPRENKDEFELEVVVPDNLEKITEALWIIAAKSKDNISFNIHFDKDVYSLNEFFSIYSKFSQKCVEKIIPYHVHK